MAAEYLKQHNIDLDVELNKIQYGGAQLQKTRSSDLPKSKAGSPERRRRESKPTNNYTQQANSRQPIDLFQNVSLHKPPQKDHKTWDVTISSGKVLALSPHDSQNPDQLLSDNIKRTINAHGALLIPSLCHPHIHLDKAFLLSHPKYAHLKMQRGDFAEAMELTSQAKADFGYDDLLERGMRVLDESLEAGVTHLRAFVEVDAGVGRKTLETGLKLKKVYEARGTLRVQICAFAQLPLFSSSPNDREGEVIRGLMQEAAAMEEVEALGSTPYVESDRAKMEKNVDWMVGLTAKKMKHLDFHLDYNIDPKIEPMVWHVFSSLKSQAWKSKTKESKTVVLGHCTRLTLFSPTEWLRLASEVKHPDLPPISFVGLPTSDLFIIRPNPKDLVNGYTRGTLPVLDMINEYGLNACIGINNIGNAFTPYGSCDPLTLACNGVGVYQGGREKDAEVLLECVTSRAREAIGFSNGKDKLGRRESGSGLKVRERETADLLLFPNEEREWRTRRSVSEAVYMYDNCKGRRGCLGGVMTK